MTRIYVPNSLSPSTFITLDEANSHHLLKVLRLKIGESLQLFNGSGGAYEATLSACEKKHAIIKVGDYIIADCESPLKIHLVQAISRGERMDYALQKSVELGVHQITPLITERCGVKIAAERKANRMLHWQKVAVSAAEQSGRCYVPSINSPVTFAEFLKQKTTGPRLICHPFTEKKALPPLAGVSEIILMIGPEGGFSEQEIKQAEQSGFYSLLLGPRILRTETAPVVALTLLQYLAGDLRL